MYEALVGVAHGRPLFHLFWGNVGWPASISGVEDVRSEAVNINGLPSGLEQAIAGRPWWGGMDDQGARENAGGLGYSQSKCNRMSGHHGDDQRTPLLVQIPSGGIQHVERFLRTRDHHSQKPMKVAIQSHSTDG